MIKVKNEKVEIINKNKKITLHNRVTDLYLDYIMWQMLPTSIGDAMYPDFAGQSDSTFAPFSYSYLEFVTTQTIADTDTTMNYDVKSSGLTTADISYSIGDMNKTILYNYDFTLTGITDGNKFTGVGFGRDADTESDYLLSFIDLDKCGIKKYDGIGYIINRYDEIYSVQTPMNNADGSYLPTYVNSTMEHGRLNAISLCYGANGTGSTYRYYYKDLTFTRLSAGIVEVEGFPNFYIGTTDYPQTDYPQTDYPLQEGKVMSVIFEYILDISGATVKTYVNIDDLDTTYNDTELKIKLKVERGEY